jgi:hypothetical protein
LNTDLISIAFSLKLLIFTGFSIHFLLDIEGIKINLYGMYKVNLIKKIKQMAYKLPDDYSIGSQKSQLR